MSDEQTEIKELYFAVGNVIVTWALLEHCLDGCVSVVFHVDSARSIQPHMPNNTRGKIQFIRSGLQSLPELSKFKAEGVALMERAMNIKDRRHDLVHSSLKSLQATNRVYTYRSIKLKSNVHHVSTWEFDLKAFPVLRQRLGALATELADFSERLTHHAAALLEARGP